MQVSWCVKDSLPTNIKVGRHCAIPSLAAVLMCTSTMSPMAAAQSSAGANGEFLHAFGDSQSLALPKDGALGTICRAARGLCLFNIQLPNGKKLVYIQYSYNIITSSLIEVLRGLASLHFPMDTPFGHPPHSWPSQAAVRINRQTKRHRKRLKQVVVRTEAGSQS